MIQIKGPLFGEHKKRKACLHQPSPSIFAKKTNKSKFISIAGFSLALRRVKVYDLLNSQQKILVASFFFSFLSQEIRERAVNNFVASHKKQVCDTVLFVVSLYFCE